MSHDKVRADLKVPNFEVKLYLNSMFIVVIVLMLFNINIFAGCIPRKEQFNVNFSPLFI